MSHGKHKSTVDFCKNKTKADQVSYKNCFESENQRKIQKKGTHYNDYKLYMWKAFGLIVVRTKTRNFETFETRKHYCFTNMRHAKHISGIETIKTDCYKENTTLRFKK